MILVKNAKKKDLLTYRFLQSILKNPNELKKAIKIGRPALTAEKSFESMDETKKKRKNVILERQRRALQDFFRDTGGKITDIRVLRSAMYLSDEIDRAIRGLDVENQYVGWRQYNRFYAEGTEDLFTNVPTGRSPLVMAAPRSQPGMRITEISKDMPLPVEYQAVRRSYQKQIGRALDEIEHSELLRLSKQEGVKLTKAQQDYLASKEATTRESFTFGEQVPSEYKFPKQISKEIVPKNDVYEPKVSSDLRVGLYQPFEPMDKKSIKERLIKFEGEIEDRRPEEDYKFEDFD